MAVSTVASQWEVAQTAFNTAESLRSLISVASRDDVQPQAILASEAFGGCLIVSARRISEAIDALGGSSSARIESIKALIGFESGTIRAIRQSTALVRFFLLVTACQLIFTNTELGDIMFDLITTSGVISRMPVSSSQLTQFINTFSAYAERIVPVDLMHETAVAVEAQGGGGFSAHHLYERLETGILADLLFRIIDNFRDDTVSRITLDGQRSGIWLATFLLWLFPEDAGLFVGMKLVKGVPNSKLSIILDFGGLDDWRIHIWRAGDPTMFIFEESGDQKAQIALLPATLTKNYINQNYLYGITNQNIRKGALMFIGALAGAFICFITEHGTLHFEKDCCKNKRQICSRVSLMDVMSQEWVARYSNIMPNYGWDDLSMDLQGQLLRALELQFQGRTHLNDNEFQSFLRSFCISLFTRFVGGGLDELFDPVLYLTATCSVTSKDRRISPLNRKDLDFAKNFICSILSPNGVSVERYLSYAFAQLLPGNAKFHSRTLVASSNGYVAGWSVLWNLGTSQRDILSIRYCIGHIKKDGFQLESIRESAFEPCFGDRKGELVNLTEGIEFKREPCAIKFETFVSVIGASLEVKHYVLLYTHPGGFPTQERASCLYSICSLATALQIGHGHQLTVRQEEELGRSLQAQNLEIR